MKIYILGTGGVGGYFGGKLAKAGNDITFLARGESYEAIKSDGLVVNNVDNNFTIKPTKVIKDISEIENPDLILFTVKTYDTESVAKSLSKYVNSNTVIISFQNGVLNDISIKKYIPNAKVYPGIAYVISTKVAPNVINQTGGLKRLVFGDIENPTNEKLIEIETLMRNAGIDANVSTDIQSDLWKKYILINASAGLTALYRLTIGEVLSNSERYAMYQECVREGILVAKALNINLPDTIFEDVMRLSSNTNPSSKSSLLVDIENNRKNEIETLNGTLVRIASEKGISVPIYNKIYSELKNIKV